MITIEQRRESLRKIGALDFAKGVCRRRRVELDHVLDTSCRLPCISRARQELFVVVMHTLDLDLSEAARAFHVDRTSLRNAEKNWASMLPHRGIA